VENPAKSGSVVTVFVTGLGDMVPRPVDGSCPVEPGAKPIEPIFVFVKQQQAEVVYAGDSPGMVHGVVRIDFRIPLTVGGVLDVVVVAGSDSRYSTAGSGRIVAQ
jgi:uncharacterized protein (TIGR03437 family)